MELAMHLWETKRWLFWLLAIPLLAFVIFEFVIKTKGASFDANLEKSKSESDKIEAKQASVQKVLTKIETKVEAVEEKLSGRKTEDVSLDWHKTFTPKDDK